MEIHKPLLPHFGIKIANLMRGVVNHFRCPPTVSFQISIGLCGQEYQRRPLISHTTSRSQATWSILEAAWPASLLSVVKALSWSVNAACAQSRTLFSTHIALPPPERGAYSALGTSYQPEFLERSEDADASIKVTSIQHVRSVSSNSQAQRGNLSTLHKG
eukprot:TRINITY_DN11379_c0_g1_i1.p1 TRINITY_DN11379_c0_g1~~TRINITY_DN11379_c0_g1_i1.p1  ORF type:complete len:160 (+),score=9.65 TRINITY_DN11379_c0_g1_i1:230-709(+)